MELSNRMDTLYRLIAEATNSADKTISQQLDHMSRLIQNSKAILTPVQIKASSIMNEKDIQNFLYHLKENYSALDRMEMIIEKYRQKIAMPNYREEQFED